MYLFHTDFLSSLQQTSTVGQGSSSQRRTNQPRRLGQPSLISLMTHSLYQHPHSCTQIHEYTPVHKPALTQCLIHKNRSTQIQTCLEPSCSIITVCREVKWGYLIKQWSECCFVQLRILNFVTASPSKFYWIIGQKKCRSVWTKAGRL